MAGALGGPRCTQGAACPPPATAAAKLLLRMLLPVAVYFLAAILRSRPAISSRFALPRLWVPSCSSVKRRVGAWSVGGAAA